jgi:hypothetical protein
MSTCILCSHLFSYQLKWLNLHRIGYQGESCCQHSWNLVFMHNRVITGCQWVPCAPICREDVSYKSLPTSAQAANGCLVLPLAERMWVTSHYPQVPKHLIGPAHNLIFTLLQCYQLVCPCNTHWPTNPGNVGDWSWFITKHALCTSSNQLCQVTSDSCWGYLIQSCGLIIWGNPAALTSYLVHNRLAMWWCSSGWQSILVAPHMLCVILWLGGEPIFGSCFKFF